jgi:ribosomal protein L7Ae-like RNA K-turn-binding protein
VKVLLRALAGFQERLREREPLNYKHKLRFVLGMKQATSSVKLGRTRLLLLAPDTEAAELIDDRLGALVSLASDNGVPVLFCLGRRRLGKAVCSSMKQSVVAVRDPDGAYDAFKSIVAFIRVCIEESSKRKAEGAPTVEVNCDVRKSEEMLKP